MFKILLSMLLVIFTTACSTAPTLNDSSAFTLINKGEISSSNILAFSDCLMDGFSESHFMTTHIMARQQRRADGYRVESLSGGIILIISANILENGRVELFESNAATLINTSGERKTFAICLDQFQVRGKHKVKSK